MFDNFDLAQPEVSSTEVLPTEVSPSPIPEYPNMSRNPLDPFDIPKKRRKPKGKKATRKALKKAERERDQLLYANGQLAMENAMMKRAMVLAVAASRRQLNDGLMEDAMRLLPPKRKERKR